MGFFGSDKKSVKQVTETNVNVSNVNETVGASDDSSVITRSNYKANTDEDYTSIANSRVNTTTTINNLDEGAIEEAFDFARKTYEQTGESFDSVLGLVGTAMERVDKSTGEIAEAYQTANQKATPVDKENIIMAAVAFAALAMILVVRRQKK